MFDFEDIYR